MSKELLRMFVMFCAFSASIVVGSLHLIVWFTGFTGSGFSQSVSKDNNEIQPSLALPELHGVFAAYLTKGADQGESHVGSGRGMAESY
jgi:hypothetical protein